MTSGAANAPRRGRPPVTSRAEILTAARRLIADEGWEKLTVRRLARVLGIGTTTIYHHVRDRDDLLIQLINDAAGRSPRPDLPDDPRERVIVVALALHDALGEMPWAADVLAVDGEACLGRPGEDALWYVDEIRSSAEEAGCTPERSGDLFVTLWFLMVGELLVQAGSARRKAKTPALDSEQNNALLDRDVFEVGVRSLVQGTLDHTD